MGTPPAFEWPEWTAPVQHASALSVTERSRRSVTVTITRPQGASTHVLAWNKQGKRTDTGALWWNFMLDEDPCFDVCAYRAEPLLLFDGQGRAIGGVRHEVGLVRDSFRALGPGYKLHGRSGLVAGVLDELAVATQWKVHSEGAKGFALWTSDVFTFRARARRVDARIDWRLVALLSVAIDYRNRL